MPQFEKPHSIQTSRQLRAGYRTEMRRALLSTALDLVASEGEDSLTIKRIAERFGSSIGTIYRFFPSKEALVAAMRQAELDDLRASAAASVTEIDATLRGSGAPAGVAALARVVGAGRFWIDAAEHAPHDVLRARQVLSDLAHSAAVTHGRDHVLDPLASVLDDAVALDALSAGPGFARAALIALIVPLSTPAIGGEVGSQPGLGRCLLECLLASWGADRDALADAHDLVADGTRG